MDIKIYSINYKLTLVLALMLIFSVNFNAYASAKMARGYVQANGLVLGDNGQPVLVEVNEKGKEINEIGELYGELEGAFVMSAVQYKLAVESHKKFMEKHGGGIAKGSYIMTIEEYNQQRAKKVGFGVVLVPAETPDQIPEEKVVQGDKIDDSSVLSVVVRALDTIIDPDRLDIYGHAIHRSPINLLNKIDIDENTKVVVVTKKGDVYKNKQYFNNVTFKVNYFQPGILGLPPSPFSWGSSVNERVLNPIQNVNVVHSYSPIPGKIKTNQYGSFDLRYFIPPCPCMFIVYQGHVFGEIPYSNFNPKTKDARKFGIFPVKNPTIDICSGMSQCPLIPTLLGAQVQLSGALTDALVSVPRIARQDLRVDVIMLSGEGVLGNTKTGGDIVLGTTEYDTNKENNPAEIPRGFGVANRNWDFDGDKKPDVAEFDPATGYYFIYLDSRTARRDSGNNLIDEDLRRLPDHMPDYQDRGLLKSVSSVDLEKTDIYIYRVSNGQMILERLGIKSDEHAPFNNHGIDDDGVNFFYRFMMPGPLTIKSRLGNADWYFSAAGIKLELFDGNKTDFLRAGEQIQIIAINRSTGYIGNINTTIELANRDGQTTIDIPTDKLVLRPPNLKIKVERKTEKELVLKLKDRTIDEFLIGSEGVGNINDKYISITTEWRKQDDEGLPLPADLPGYSAILAKIISNQKLANDKACSSQINAIEIRPGNHMQLLKLKEGCDLKKEHYYLYVCGHNLDSSDRDECFDFSDPGRPAVYTPIKVPIYDEIATRRQDNLYRYALQDGNTPPPPEPVYRWHYRPEMQFSVFDFDLDEMTIQYRESGGTTSEETIDLSNNPDEAIDRVFAYNINYAEFIYDLLNPGHDQSESLELLDSFAPERQFILAIGEEEVSIIDVKEDGSVRFENPNNILNLNSTDIATMRLYLNTDTSNLIWHLTASGIFAYYKLPTPEIMMLRDKDEPPNIPDDEKWFRVLGGARIRMEYVPPNIEEVISYEWSVDSGRFMSGYGQLATEIEKPRTAEVFYETNSWKTGLTIGGKVTIKFINKDNLPDKRDERFHIITRELQVVAGDEMEGSDVEMLESLLWHLGISPQNGYTGIAADRINRENASPGDPVPGPAGIDSQRRYRYYGGAQNCAGGTIPNKRTATIEMMVKRFKGRHAYTAGTVNSPHPGRCSARAIAARGENQTGNVDNEVLKNIKLHYEQYMKSTIDDSIYRNMPFIPNLNLTIRNLAEQAIFSTSTWPAWDRFQGEPATGNTDTYTQDYHNAAFQNRGTRLDLLDAWLTHESGGIMWGITSKRNRNSYPYRMGMGGGDEFGSLGLNHILFSYIYGADRKNCEHLDAIADNQISQYEPVQNAKNLILYASHRDEDCANTGLHVFDMAININSWQVDYNNANHNPNVRGACTIGTVNGSCANTNWINATSHNGSYPYSEYDQIAKALWAYNGGPGIRRMAWVRYLLTTIPSHTKPQRGRYSIKIRRDAGLPRRSYAIQWKTLNAAEAANYSNMNTGDSVCYWYSEDDWYGTDRAFGVPHTNILNALTGLEDDRVIKCDDGQRLQRI